MHSCRTALACLTLALVVCAGAWAQLTGVQQELLASPFDGHHSDIGFNRPTRYLPIPLTLTVATLGDEFNPADISDVEVADFNGDGRKDIAVAWFATDPDDRSNNLRYLTLYFGVGTHGFERAVDIDLYIPDEQIEALSVFRNGSSDIGVGDFDGDGDLDLAVTVFFGDELWFIENLGDGQFVPYLKFPFGYNSTGNFQTPPEALAADFDGDGRDELVYIADALQYIQGYMLHFWKTDNTIANMHRVYWEGISGTQVQYTRGLALADFDGDDRPDLCFSGSVNPPYEDDPVLVFWHNLNTSTRRFDVQLEYPGFLCSDVVAVQPDPLCPPGVLLTDLDGTQVEYWAQPCGGAMDFYLAAAEDGYAGLAPNRGMTAEIGDVDGDGDPDLVTRQKLGGLSDENQIEVTLYAPHGQMWTRTKRVQINTSGFQDLPWTEHLRPRNLAVADLFGNTLPEIVAGFGPAPADDPHESLLRVAYWANDCIADVTMDGRTNMADLAAILADFGRPVPPANPEADLNKDGVVDLGDISVFLADFGCDCRENVKPPSPL